MARLRAGMITVALTALLFAGGAAAQQGPSPPPGAAVQTSRPQLDDLLAPVALYPDPLLSQILMAASYPVEVVLADRWLADPGNARLTDGDLVAVVNQQAWDPSVKSLVAFPRILAMMDSHLQWTQDLETPSSPIPPRLWMRCRTCAGGRWRPGGCKAPPISRSARRMG